MGIMDTGSIVHLRLPSSTIAELDRRAGVELRSRANLATLLIVQGLAVQAEPNTEKES
jgi:hypothetical protein